MSTGYAGIPNDPVIITIPDDNDLADGESVNRAFRALKDGLLFSVEPAARGPIHHMVAFDSFDAATIRVKQVPHFILYRTPTPPLSYVSVERAPEVVTSAALDVAPGAWQANRTYYLYLRFDVATNSVKYMVSLTAPDKQLVFIGTPTRTVRYCGCFTTNGAAQVRPIQKVGRSYRYLEQVAPPAFGGSDIAFTQINLSAFKPPHARRMRLRAWASTTNPVSDTAYLRRNGGPGQSELWALPGAAISDTEIELLTDDAGLIEYKVSDALASLNLRVVGFTEGEAE